MPRQLVPLNSDQHSHLKVADGIDFTVAAGQQLLPVSAFEFAHAATDLPVVFVKNSDTGQFQAVVLLGFRPDENLLLNGDKWLSPYVPTILTLQPFGLIPSEADATQLMIAIDEVSPLVGVDKTHTIIEGGKQTEYMDKRQKAITDYFEQSQATGVFVKELTKLELLVERSLNVEVGGEKVNLNGLYFVDEAKLNALTDEQYLELRKRGYLGVIYAHLTSLNQLRRLVNLKADKAKA